METLLPPSHDMILCIVPCTMGSPIGTSSKRQWPSHGIQYELALRDNGQVMAFYYKALIDDTASKVLVKDKNVF